MEVFVAKCQHCGNETTQIILHQVIKEEVGVDNSGQPHPYLAYYCFTVCGTCKNHSFFSIINGDDGNEFSLYPLEQSIHISIPSKVSKVYSEALKVKKLSAISFFLLLRKSLEIICENQNSKGKDLKEKIKYLHVQSKMPTLILNVANKTRLLGNLSAHESDIIFTNEDVEIMDDLFQAIIEYVYIIPYKLSKLTERMKPGLNKKVRTSKEK